MTSYPDLPEIPRYQRSIINSRAVVLCMRDRKPSFVERFLAFWESKFNA